MGLALLSKVSKTSPIDNEPWDWISVVDRPAAADDLNADDKIVQDCCLIDESWQGDDELDADVGALNLGGANTQARISRTQSNDDSITESSGSSSTALLLADEAASATAAAAAAEAEAAAQAAAVAEAEAAAAAALAAIAAAESEWKRTHVELELRNVKLISKEAGGVMQLGAKDDERFRNHVLPIHMGEPETQALLRHTSKRTNSGEGTGRPMTHDLLASMAAACGGRVARVDIHDFQRATYYAQVHIVLGQSTRSFDVSTTVLDARPSDAVNLAVRTGARIYAGKSVMELMSRVEK